MEPRPTGRLTRMRLACTLLLVAASLGSTSCSTTLYDWGDYERSVLALETEFLDSDLLDEITRLERQVEDSVGQDRPAPPGLHAHVGYLQYLAGNSDAALRHFEAEKSLYPQSAVFMDGLIGRL